MRFLGFRTIFKVFLVILAIGAGLVVWGYQDLRKPVAHSKATTYIEIPKGSSPPQILEKLQDEGVIRRVWPLLVYIRLTGDYSKLKAGDYKFATPISPLSVLRKLREGEQRLNRFTVKEGWTRWDIAEAMTHVPEFQIDSPSSALPLMNDVDDIKDIDSQASNLEGYLFPDTYSFPPNAKPETAIAEMVKRFREEWKPEWQSRSAAMKLSPREIITVASLIETEAKLKEERPIIASVIYNRITKKMPLGVDSAVVYASKLAGTWRNDGKVYQSDLTRKSPYNTRINVGLPPGPIGSPGAASIEAALFPASTNYLYYVREPSRNDGAHNFYSNPADFEKGVQALRDWEKRRDAANTNTDSKTLTQ